jgi:hypothetical protein
VAASALGFLAAPLLAHAQSKQYSFNFKGDGLARQEWTRELFQGADQSRWRLQGRPRLEFGIGSFVAGVGGEFNYSKDDNIKPPEGAASLALLRDNYKSRDKRLDLAYLSIKPVGWIKLEGGRFEMPPGLTEMIWDKDLRPQGGALTLEKKDASGARRFGVTALYAQGSHVFEDGKAKLLLGQAEVGGKSVSLVGSYMEWRQIEDIDRMIRRQNTRVSGSGVYANRYRVVDGVLRLRKGGQVQSQLIVDYCRNLSVSQDNQGLWITGVVGSTLAARGRLVYTFASVDKDATLAAFATDDFFWATGWTGHRADFGLRGGDHSALHAVAQWQRFKDSPRPEEREHWVKRYRLELRIRQ